MIRCINNLQPDDLIATSSARNHVPVSTGALGAEHPLEGERLYEEIYFRPGYAMTIVKHQRAYGVKKRFDHDQAPVSLCFNLTQKARCTITAGGKVKRIFERGAGDGVLAYLPHARGVLESPRGEKVVGVTLSFPVQVFGELFGITNRLLGRSSLPPTAGSQNAPWFYWPGKVEPETKYVLWQILQCPYVGKVRELFMEAKSLELVAHKLAELGPAKHGGAPDLSKHETEQVREAYQIMLERLADPPSLMKLSRLVGINRNKLNQGFKKLFGDTVFNVMRKARLVRACHLLQETELTISEIGYLVGYNSQANFTTAFNRHFGQTPNDVRQNGLRQRQDS